MPYNRYFLRLLPLLLLFHSLPLYRKVFQSSLLLPEAFLLSTLLQYHHKCKKISVDLTDTQQFRHQTPSYAKPLKFLKSFLLRQAHLSFLLFHKASAPGPSDNFPLKIPVEKCRLFPLLLFLYCSTQVQDLKTDVLLLKLQFQVPVLSLVFQTAHLPLQNRLRFEKKLQFLPVLPLLQNGIRNF